MAVASQAVLAIEARQPATEAANAYALLGRDRRGVHALAVLLYHGVSCAQATVLVQVHGAHERKSPKAR